MTREDVGKLLDAAPVPANLRDRLLADDKFHKSEKGVELLPSYEDISSIPEEPRLKIYRYLSQFRENDEQFEHFPLHSMEERLKDCGVSEATVGLIKGVGCTSGKCLIFSGAPSVLSKIPDYKEKARFFKATTWEKTLLLKMHLTAASDIPSLVSYWGKATWNTDVRSMLESLSKVPDGVWVDVVEVLPPFPTALLYTYPQPENPLAGPQVFRDCFWTAFNFFREPQDPHYGEIAYVAEKLVSDYYSVLDPRYGDVVLFSKPNGVVVHAAVFLADNVVYTKNGPSIMHPWQFSTIPDLLEMYSFMVEPNEKLSIAYYRNKYY